MPAHSLTVPAQGGAAFTVQRGERVRITDVQGQQVGDLVAFNAEDESEWLSTVHTRGMLSRLTVHRGDILYSNRRRAVFEIVEDPVGTHDIMWPSCDARRYEIDYNLSDHPNCHDNLRKALREHDGREPVYLPDPVNIFMNNRLHPDGSISIEAPLTRAGDAILLEARLPLVCALSCCPQPFNPCNGYNPSELHVEILHAP